MNCNRALRMSRAEASFDERRRRVALAHQNQNRLPQRVRPRKARPPHRRQLKQMTDVESALHDFERRTRDLQRVVQALSKDVENYLGSTPL